MVIVMREAIVDKHWGWRVGQAGLYAVKAPYFVYLGYVECAFVEDYSIWHFLVGQEGVCGIGYTIAILIYKGVDLISAAISYEDGSFISAG